jgi:hypothetical protein
MTAHISRRGFLATAAIGFAQNPPRSYDESKVRAYTLPDPLQFDNGKRVKNKADWDRRRVELLRLFEQNVYGRTPQTRLDTSIEVGPVDPIALNGKAHRKSIRIHFRKGAETRTLDLLIYLPKKRTGPAPMFVGVNFRGNHTITKEADIPLMSKWVYPNGRAAVNNRSTEASRGSQANQWPIEQILDGGYGLATFYAGDLSPDYNEGFAEGIEPLFYRAGQKQRDADEWGALGAWAWGLSRCMDYFETDPDIDTQRVAVMGHSRMGKTALWVGAQDKRFAMVISNCSGAGGATIVRRRFGESAKDLEKNFPWWFCANYAKYSDNEDALPVDQHELLALAAPRPLYIAVAEEDRGSDPYGQFLSAVAATPVYTLLGVEGLGLTRMPEVSRPVLSRIGFHMRPGKHDITPYDWAQYIAFARKWMG